MRFPLSSRTGSVESVEKDPVELDWSGAVKTLKQRRIISILEHLRTRLPS